MQNPPLIPCGNHGPSAWCYDTQEGHKSSESCTCFWKKSKDCPVHGDGNEGFIDALIDGEVMFEDLFEGKP